MDHPEVVLFLELVRSAHAAGRLGYRRNDRKVSMATLAELGLTTSDMLDRVARLEPSQALHSPWDNRNPAFPHEKACDFGIVVEETGVYVKVCIGIRNDESTGCVISFHLQDRPFDFLSDK